MYPQQRKWYEKSEQAKKKPSIVFNPDALKQRRTEKPVENEEVVKLKEQLKIAKKEQKKAVDNAEKHKKELKQFKRDAEVAQQQVNDLKRKVFEQGQSIKDIEEAKKPFVDKIAELETQIESLNTQLANSNETALKTEIHEQQRKNDSLRQSNVDLRKENLDLKTKNRNLVGELKFARSVEHTAALNEELNSYRRAYNSTQVELASFKAKYEELSGRVGDYNHLSVKHLLKMLDERLSVHTIDEFADFGILFGRWSDIKTAVKLNPSLKNKPHPIVVHGPAQPIKEPKPQLQEVLGFIKEEWFQCYFEDLEGNRFSLKNPEDETASEQPVSVIIKDDLAIVVKRHDATAKPVRTPMNRRIKLKVNRPKREYEQIGNFTVLVIGSRHKRTYLERLRAHGLDPVWHDPFEDGIAKLRGNFSHADIVVICTDHISHTTTDVIDKNHEKVVQIDDDSADSIVDKIKEKAEQLELVHA